MSYIQQIEPEEATGKLKQVYDEILKTRGRIDSIYKLHSLDADLLQAHRDTYFHTMSKIGGLSRLERAALAVAVSVSNECSYCIHRYVSALRIAEGSEDLIERLKLGEEPEDQPERLVRLIYYARKLTLLPGSAERKDIEVLREVGLTDLEIMQAVQVIGYFNYVSRIANGLGVEG